MTTDSGSEEVPPPLEKLDPELLELIYDELREIARRTLGDWPAQHSINATALVHEAWLRMQGQDCFAGLSREKLISFAALSVRRVLVDDHRNRRTLKKGDAYRRVPMMDVPLDGEHSVEFPVLDAALQTLEEIAPRPAKVVELKFFGNLSIDQTADVLDVSVGTVKADWRYARAWLLGHLRERNGH